MLYRIRILTDNFKKLLNLLYIITSSKKINLYMNSDFGLKSIILTELQDLVPENMKTNEEIFVFLVYRESIIGHRMFRKVC